MCQTLERHSHNFSSILFGTWYTTTSYLFYSMKIHLRSLLLLLLLLCLPACPPHWMAGWLHAFASHPIIHSIPILYDIKCVPTLFPSVFSILSDVRCGVYICVPFARVSIHNALGKNFNCKSARCHIGWCGLNCLVGGDEGGGRAVVAMAALNGVRKDIDCLAIANTIALQSNAIKWQATLSFTHSRKTKLFRRTDASAWHHGVRRGYGMCRLVYGRIYDFGYEYNHIEYMHILEQPYSHPNSQTAQTKGIKRRAKLSIVVITTTPSYIINSNSRNFSYPWSVKSAPHHVVRKSRRPRKQRNDFVPQAKMLRARHSQQQNCVSKGKDTHTHTNRWSQAMQLIVIEK